MPKPSLDEIFEDSSTGKPSLDSIFSGEVKEKQPDRMVGFFGSVPQSKYNEGERNIMGNIFERPGAAIRSALQGKGYVQGAMNPTNVPSFQNLALEKYGNMIANSTSKIPNETMRNLSLKSANPALMGVSALGLGADILTNPADVLGMVAGKTPVGSGKTISTAVGNTKVAQAIGRFINKPRSFLKFGKDAVLDISKRGVRGVEKLDTLAGQKYEKGIQNIKGVSKEIKPIVDKIDEAIEMYPNESYTTLKKIKTNLSSKKKPVKELTAEELRNLKQEVKRGIPKSVFQGKTDATPQQSAQLRVYNQIDDGLVKLGGDDYIKMKAEYSDWKNTASDAYKVLLEEGRPGDVNLRNWFGYGISRRKFKALEKVSGQLPPKEQFMQEFLAWRRGQIAKGALTAGIPASYLLHRYLAEKTVSR